LQAGALGAVHVPRVDGDKSAALRRDTEFACGVEVGLACGVGFANSGGLVFMDESAEEVAAA
jgi:hypothetical protein